MGNTIPDIPRLYTALAEWLSCCMFALLLVPKIEKYKVYVFSAIYFIILAFFMEMTATITLWLWIPCMIAAFLSMAVFIWLCNKRSFYESVYYAFFAFSMAECIASLEWQLVNFFFEDVEKMPLWAEALMLVFVYVAALISLWRLFKLCMTPEKRYAIEKKDWFTALFIVVTVFAFSNLSFMTRDYPFSGQYSRDIANVRTLVDIAGVAALYAHLVSCNNNAVSRELDAVQNVLQNQYKQYKQSRESIDLINMKYHDLKHQIQILREMNEREERDELLDRMEAEIKAYELQNKTGNSVLDTLLTGKSMYCDKHGITMTVVADGSLLGFMDTMDICSIFGNALDNAIESVLKINEKEKRLIHVTVSKIKSFVMIRIQNYLEEEIEIGKDYSISTKKDKKFHGYGIKSIQYTANRYEGVVNIKAENNWFELKILIPFNE